MQDNAELGPWTWVLGYLFPASNEKLIAFFAPILTMLDHVLPEAPKKLQQACMVHKRVFHPLTQAQNQLKLKIERT